MLVRCLLGTLGLLASITFVRAEPFSRYTDDLTRALEKEAVQAMAVGATYDIAAKLCARIRSVTGDDARASVTEWRRKNDLYIRAASSVLNEFGDRYLPIDGDAARQRYFQGVLGATAKAARLRLLQELNGSGLENDVVPPERACIGLTQLLRDGVADFERSPETIRTLLAYMQRKGIH